MRLLLCCLSNLEPMQTGGGGRKRSKTSKITKGKCKYSYKCKPHKKKQLCTYTYKCPSKKTKVLNKENVSTHINANLTKKNNYVNTHINAVKGFKILKI